MEETHTGGMFRGAALGHLCDAYLAVDDVDGARRCAEEAVEFCQSRGLRLELLPWLALTRSRIRGGADGAALEAIEETQQLIDETGAIVYQPFLHECRAAFAKVFKSEWSAEGELHEAHRLFTKLGATGHVDRITALL